MLSIVQEKLDGWSADGEDQEGRRQEARYAVKLLAEVQSPRALTLLGQALRQGELGRYALRFYQPRETLESVRFLERACAVAATAPMAQALLVRLANAEELPEVAGAARAVLEGATKATPSWTSPPMAGAQMRA